MKIDRTKLDILLRSGLNPDIKTRKQLAAHLGLDPTSLTRWFATRDRLGNPRFPVVPDRHVTKILQLFNLDPMSLHLDNVAFRDVCFGQSLSQSNHETELAQKNQIRLENARQRTLDMSHYVQQPPIRRPVLIASFVLAFLSAVYVVVQLTTMNSSERFAEELLWEREVACWTGYSPSLGVFDKDDKADPCHYGKLFHNALIQLRNENRQLNLSEPDAEQPADHAYIAFLFEHLEHRRTRDAIVLHVELGKNEMHRANFQVAESHFLRANEMLASLPENNVELSTEISSYLAKIP